MNVLLKLNRRLLRFLLDNMEVPPGEESEKSVNYSSIAAMTTAPPPPPPPDTSSTAAPPPLPTEPHMPQPGQPLLTTPATPGNQYYDPAYQQYYQQGYWGQNQPGYHSQLAAQYPGYQAPAPQTSYATITAQAPQGYNAYATPQRLGLDGMNSLLRINHCCFQGPIQCGNRKPILPALQSAKAQLPVRSRSKIPRCW